MQSTMIRLKMRVKFKWTNCALHRIYEIMVIHSKSSKSEVNHPPISAVHTMDRKWTLNSISGQRPRIVWTSINEIDTAPKRKPRKNK